MWIFGNAPLDLAVLYAGGCLAFAVVWLVPESARFATLFALATLAVVDTGHMYTTVWRTWFRKKELKGQARYWIAPLAACGGVFLWALLRIPYLFNVILYTTIFHHMRQYYGVVRWYEKLNRRTSRPSHWFVTLLFVLPLAFAHFRTDGIKQIFYKGDLLVYPSPALYSVFLVLYLAVVASWIGYEAHLVARGIREPNRVLAIFVPMLFTGVGCYFGKSAPQIILPLVWTHGITYFGLMALSMRRLDPKRWRSALFAAIPVVLTAIVAGSLVLYLDEIYLETEYLAESRSFFELAFIAVIQTPTICHYLFDAWIWTGRHRDAKVVYAMPATALRK